MPRQRQIITHILIMCDSEQEIDKVNKSTINQINLINKCEIRVEGNLSNDIMNRLIDYFTLALRENQKIG